MPNRYPTDEDLSRIRSWGWSWASYNSSFPSYQEVLSFMDFVRSCWWNPEWGWSEEDTESELGNKVHRYSLSTGGWSGNESLIDAMQGNWFFWTFWISSRRGGHFVFEIPLDPEGPEADCSEIIDGAHPCGGGTFCCVDHDRAIPRVRLSDCPCWCHRDQRGCGKHYPSAVYSRCSCGGAWPCGEANKPLDTAPAWK